MSKLTDMQKGAEGTVVSINGDSRFVSRVTSIGLTPGCKVSMIKNEKDSPIIILDEATANVDPENEAELTKAIEELTKDKTIIMIAHRLKTVRNADQIIVLEDGKISDKGTHDELMGREGIYRDFVNERKEAISWKIA